MTSVYRGKGDIKATLLITGFGEFHGVKSNPTEEMIGNTLISYLQENPVDGIEIIYRSVLEVSAVGALHGLLEMQRRTLLHSNVKAPVFWIHFGVNGSTHDGHIQLEEIGWNEANFRCNDERGWTPASQPISRTTDVDHFKSSINVPFLVESLRSKSHTVKASQDPGRFICNWIYFNSLQHAKETGAHSLFVHVPPFDAMNRSTQLKIIRDLFQSLTHADALPSTAHQSVRPSALGSSSPMEWAKIGVVCVASLTFSMLLFKRLQNL
eukprot:TRINITY_DN2981_c0_g1_i1.p1 TRINITY_DN2981_c0_g1~~TRINITY_DN2981_c0_g1_i1.p1  ORF type:complete len:267 (-),score=34.75 TRINITY_DN2981_c0_g1_i1:884-1684(-)